MLPSLTAAVWLSAQKEHCKFTGMPYVSQKDILLILVKGDSRSGITFHACQVLHVDSSLSSIGASVGRASNEGVLALGQESTYLNALSRTLC